MTKNPPAFLVGIDLEPLPLTDPTDPQSWADLQVLTGEVLSCLDRHGWKATFFTVGQVAEKCPELIAEISSQGHEIGCHTHAHHRLGHYTPDQFKDDLDRNLKALRAAGATELHGFRAPFFSLTEKVSWIYEILASFGIKYSSSVSASRNASGGWSGRAPLAARRSGVIEMPITALSPAVPLGGVYWRCCPEPILLRRLRRIAAGTDCITAFFHAHDFHSPRARYVGLDCFLKNPLMAPIMVMGRRSVEDKLSQVSTIGFRHQTFADYLELSKTSRSRENPSKRVAR
jgi:peptidoglycan-N-acetylglucosamine deacetylase